MEMAIPSRSLSPSRLATPISLITFLRCPYIVATPYIFLFFFLKSVIFSNLTTSMKVVVQNMEKLGIKFSDEANEVKYHWLNIHVF